MVQKQFLMLLGIGGLVFILSVTGLYQCPFRLFLHIPCGGCGMTTAMKYLLQGDIIAAMHANILSVPLALAIVFLIVIWVFDLLQHQNRLETIWNLYKKPGFIWVVASLFFLSWAYNVAHYFSFI
ncbi:MAG: DUF2752 domain-containing protein [Erysipelotrichaceae bacterium]